MSEFPNIEDAVKAAGEIRGILARLRQANKEGKLSDDDLDFVLTGRCQCCKYGFFKSNEFVWELCDARTGCGHHKDQHK